MLNAALAAADPRLAVLRALHRQGSDLLACGRRYHLNDFNKVWVFGIGKAVLPMFHGLQERLEEKIDGGVLIAKHIAENAKSTLPPGVLLLQGGHPVPDEYSLKAAQTLWEVLGQSGPDDLIICLISGGGSALCSLPEEGITLADMQTLTQSLLACGADIGEINLLRKHLDRLKGGKLARRAAPAQLLTLILSDVIGNPLDVIASGPTVADPGTFAQALAVIAKYNLQHVLPAVIVKTLENGCNGRLAETVKPGEACLDGVNNLLIASNEQAARAAVRAARRAGLHSRVLTTRLSGEASLVGKHLAGVLRRMALEGKPLPRPACLVAGGETTVTLHGKGMGGRNLEVALGATEDLAGLQGVTFVSLATDGEDGSAPAAGAYVTGDTLEYGLKLGLSPGDFLDRNDSFHYFEALGDLLMPGPTGTNVNDLAFLFTFQM